MSLSFSPLLDSSVCPGGPKADAWVALAADSWLVAEASKGRGGSEKVASFYRTKESTKSQLQGPRKLSPLPQEPQPRESASRSLSSPPPHPRLSPFCFLIPKRRENKLTHLFSALTSLPLPGFGRAAELFTCHSEWSSSSTLLHRTRITILIKKHL